MHGGLFLSKNLNIRELNWSWQIPIFYKNLFLVHFTCDEVQIGMVIVRTCKCVTLGFILTRPYLISSNWLWNSENKIFISCSNFWVDESKFTVYGANRARNLFWYFCSWWWLDILLSSSQNIYKFKLCFS